MGSNVKKFMFSQALSDSTIFICCPFLLLRILLLLALVVSYATSQEKPFDSGIPTPDITYSNPKSSLLQLAWTTSSSDEIKHFKVLATDSSLKSFTCENENYNEGYCTISGLSADTTYNVTVTGCSDVACGTPAVVYIRTASTPRLFFGTIFAIFVVLVLLAFAVLNYDLVGELLGPCWKTVKLKLFRRQSITPEVPLQDAEPTAPQEPAESPDNIDSNDITNDSSLACSSEGIAGPSTPSELTIDNEASSEKTHFACNSEVIVGPSTPSELTTDNGASSDRTHVACNSEGIIGPSTSAELTTDNEVSSEKNQKHFEKNL